MDGLSLAANIFAVIGAAQSAAHGLQKLKSLREAPEQVLLLLGEVSDLQTVLSVVQKILENLLLCNQFQDPVFNRCLAATIERAFNTLNEVNGVIESGLIRNPEQMPNRRVKISWKIWLRNHGYLSSVSSRLRDVKVELASVLTLLTASEVPRLRDSLQRMLVDNQLMVHDLQNSQRELANLSSISTKVLGSLESLGSQHSSEPVASHNSWQEPKRNSHDLPIQKPNYPQTGCRKLCICRCHERRIFASPRWSGSLFGQIVIAYSGMARSENQSCNIASCQEWKSKQTVFKATYFFPKWLLQRVVVVCDRWSPPMGHLIRIRTPRVVAWCPRFYAATMGRTHSLQKEFADGTGSPFDTLENGVSLLHLAVVYRNVDTCRFLMQNHADPEQEDSMLQSPVDILATHFILESLNPTNIELKQVFSPHFDLNESLGKIKFTDLHKVVLDLTPKPIDLDAYLQLSTAEIEARCSLGRTPLIWAATSARAQAIKILLKHGAKIDDVDDSGQNVFHRTASYHSGDITETLSILLKATASISPQLQTTMINQPSHNGTKPLDYACQNNKPKQVALFLSHGALPEPSPSTPVLETNIASIFHAIDSNNHDAIESLLAVGAKTNVKDNLRKSILHIIAEDADLKTIRIFLRADPPVAVQTNEIDIFGLTPMEQYEKHIDNFAAKDETYKNSRRKAFLELLQQSERLSATPV